MAISIPGLKLLGTTMTTIQDIEFMHTIKKGQMPVYIGGLSAIEQLCSLAT
jgi:hypothetical protein